MQKWNVQYTYDLHGNMNAYAFFWGKWPTDLEYDFVAYNPIDKGFEVSR